MVHPDWLSPEGENGNSRIIHSCTMPRLPTFGVSL